MLNATVPYQWNMSSIHGLGEDWIATSTRPLEIVGTANLQYRPLGYIVSCVDLKPDRR